tara:strand:+ start:522 stop:668 length:147 start_codon:yes stop_codon:yes gene_type:complete
MWPPLPASVALVATWRGGFGKYHDTQNAREDPEPDDHLITEHDFTVYP